MEPPATTDNAPARQSLIAAVTLIMVAVGVSGSLALADTIRPETLGGEAAKYVPEDGHSAVSTERAPGLSILRHSDSARSIGYSELLLLPNLAAEAAVEANPNPEAAQFWRESTRWNSAEGIRELVELHELTTAGVSLVASVGTDVGFVYTPALLELPADITTGAAWSSEGEAMPGGILTYRATGSAHAPSTALLELAQVDDADGCTEVRATIDYRDTDNDIVLVIAKEELWCEGRGRVATKGTVDDTSVTIEPTNAGQLRPTSVSQARKWPDPNGWTAHDTAIILRDPWFADRSFRVAASQHPEVTSSGHVVVANHHGHDITALDTAGGEVVQVWRAHPGGHIVTFTVIGDVIVVSTSHRELVAYTHRGEELWRTSHPELVVARVTPTTDSHLAIVGLDGSLTIADTLTGEAEWTRTVMADVEHPPLVVDGTVIVIDRAGKMTAFTDTGDIRWRHESTSVAATTALADAFVIATESGMLVTHSAHTGEPLADRHYPGTVRALTSHGDRIILATDEGLFALDPSTLATLWQADPALDIITDPEHVIAVRRTAAHLLDDRGRDVTTWPLTEHSSASPRYHTALPRGIFAFSEDRATLVTGP